MDQEARIAELEALLREVVRAGTTYRSGDDYFCMHCNGEDYRNALGDRSIDHEPGCLYLRLRAALGDA